MRPNRAQILTRERRWSTRAALAALLGAIFGLAGFFVLRTSISSGSTNFAGLEEAHANSSQVYLAGALTLIGFALLLGPLLYLFRAAQARSERVKNQLIGLVVLGPVLLAITGFMLAPGTQQAANNYIEGKSHSTLTKTEGAKECREEEQKEGAQKFGEEFEPKAGGTALASCEFQKQEESSASNAIRHASLIGFAQFGGLAGAFALIIGLFYTCLWAMRTGLLSRFWGSLGMGVGFASLIGFSPLLFLWFIYLGLLILGRLPGGKPSAWETGESKPWVSPGEKIAAEMEPKGEVDVGDVVEGEAAEGPVLEAGDGDDAGPQGKSRWGGSGGPRKRKRRD